MTAPIIPVSAIDPTRRTNADLIVDVARLGYLEGDVLDLTYSKGNFWTRCRPSRLTTNDVNPKWDTDHHWDFTDVPLIDDCYDTVVLDPPYRLNGTPDQDYDAAYGISQPTRWQDRMALILDGTREACRLSRRYVLVKCQAQVVSGAVRWQDFEVTLVARGCGFRLRDRFDLVTAQRSQPADRRQVHARRNHSTLLVFERN